MRCYNRSVLLIALVACSAAFAQGPTYQRGRTPTQEEIRAWDISISPSGMELPPGKGTAKEGANIYAQKCAECHGPTGAEGDFRHGRLVGGKGTLNTTRPIITLGSFWPFATTIWDYINRSMPMYRAGSLSADEVYALTAVLLYRNGIIQENDVIDAKSLPKIQMPNRNGFFPTKPVWKPGTKREFGLYP
ncbi:MAG: cytochrome c [Acidobacteria bacterium]|nr:cytochrome c [Acidobacteriota bacterium]